MATTIGPTFALQVSRPSSWNPDHLGLKAEQIAVEHNGQGLIVDIHGATFRQSIRFDHPHWVFVAEIIKDDGRALYGFETPLERALFIELWELDSIGPKTAAHILAELGPAGIKGLITGQLTGKIKVAGLGPKTLDKLIHGLQSSKEKFEKLLLSFSGGVSRAGAVPFSGDDSRSMGVLVGALEKLGLRPADSLKICEDLEAEGQSVSALELGEAIKVVVKRWGQMRHRGSAQASAERSSS